MASKSHINNIQYAFFKRETGETGSLQGLKLKYLKQRLGL